ncbi:MAG: type II toxin-antitoxin system RelE/ParE family toxin [Lysobacter sp.]
MKPAIWSAAAEQDSAETAYWYATQGGSALGERFLGALEVAIGHLSRQPGSGSSRYAMPLNLDGLRFWPISGFPYLIFYVERDTQLDVWRVLHAQRDIPGWMREPSHSARKNLPDQQKQD